MRALLTVVKASTPLRDLRDVMGLIRYFATGRL
jgi:hypothetical protein